MEILIDGQTLATPEMGRGIGVYFRNVIENLLANDLANGFRIVANDVQQLECFSPWARERLRFLKTDPWKSFSETERTAEYSGLINRIIEEELIDLYWTPNPLMTNVLLAQRESTRATFAATVFDVIPLAMKDVYERQWPPDIWKNYEARLDVLKRDYDLFLHISASTRDDFQRLVQSNGKRHVVTLLAAGERFRPYPFPEFSEKKSYILFPGGFDPRKNMDGAVEAFARLVHQYPNDAVVQSTDLVIACHYNDASRAVVDKQARKLGVADRIHLTGYISDDEIVSLYQKARCLFFPSFYEGFGLPVLEGLACGLPIAASNTSSIPEVAGNLALYFDPHNAVEMAETLYRTLLQPTDVATRLLRYQHAQQFSWTKTALRTLAAWDNATEEIDRVPAEAPQPPLIDVRQRINELTVEELCGTANEFFARLDNWDYLHTKPFAAVNETPELLFCFAKVVEGLKLLPDMRILDFGAGSCWTSRFLSQMGLEVIACDVSEAALEIGRDLYRRLPVIGAQPVPSFLKFDGHRFDLPDEHVDRISCLDAFHHVPNQQEVLNEMARVLKMGGIVGFSEPGPQHSLAPQSQYEMRTHRVIENDVDVHAIWEEARKAGFTDMKVAFINPNPLLLSIEDFAASLNGDGGSDRYLSEARNEMRHRRLFFLYKGEATTPADSRQRDGLMAELNVDVVSTVIAAGEKFRVKAVAKNTGTNVWLPASARTAAVRFGVHLFDENGVLLDLDYFRAALTPGEDRQIQPNEVVELDVEVPGPPRGKYTLQFDLVSEAVCWFEHNGARTVSTEVQVV